VGGGALAWAEAHHVAVALGLLRGRAAGDRFELVEEDGLAGEW
jgi:hypothetical protein